METKFTKKQRGKIYLKAAKIIANETGSFMCDAVEKACGIEPTSTSFPEMFAFRESSSAVWMTEDHCKESFSDHPIGRSRRVTALLFASEMCK